jgi:hypothetical protein
MLKFFRRIRQKLIIEGNLKRYLIYAVGEILLVMIGILLALQVNNWNENKKLKRLEASTLKELKANLLKDIEDFEGNIKIHKICVQSSKIIIDALNNRNIYHDSLNIHLGKIPANPIFMPTTSAYQNLKTIGINLISNDSLRMELQGLYEARYAYTAKMTEMGYNSDWEEFGKMYQKEMSEFILYVNAHPLDYNSLSANQQFINLISHKISRLEYHIIPNYEQKIELITKIINMIDKELSKT